jgi:Flp pilus assembly protein CpaB
MKMYNIFVIVIIAAIIAGAMVGSDMGTNRWVDNSGAVHYNHPENDYQVAVEELNNYVPVYEQEIADNNIGDVIGQTWFQNDIPVKVLIERQEPGVVYHEMGHVVLNGGTEPQADAFATAKGFPIHDGTY